ncbi:twitchin-like [Ciona intestinalis]
MSLKEFKKPDEAAGESFPSLTKPPGDAKGAEDKRIEVRCTIEGNPTPKVVWRKGQWLQIDDGGRYDVKRSIDSGSCTMAIKSARSSDAGRYKLVATNDFGELTVPFSVKIDRLVRTDSQEALKNFKTQLKHREVKKKEKKTPEEREKEVLDILKTSDPKDYERICMQYGFYDFRLILHKLQKLTRVDVDEPEFEAAKVLKGLKHVTVNDEGTAVFEIHLENVSPNKQMMWYKDGEVVQVPGPEKRHELRRIGNVFQLIIRNANSQDAGTYTLDIGGEKFDAILTIKEQPLKFNNELRSQSAKVKGRCVFECVVSRRGQKVTWLKDGKPITLRGGTSRLQAVSEAKCHKLIISELEMADAGRYSVRVGDIESAADLTVAAAAIRFRNRLVNTEVKEKASATFECSVSSKDVKPVWTVNGEVVKTGGKYTIKSGDVHSLTFKRVTLADHKAEVKVSFGDVSSAAELQVNEKAFKVLSKMKNVKSRSGKPVEFSCEIDDPDVDSPVQWYKDDKPIKPSSKYEMVKKKGKYTLKVKDIKPEDEGVYQFQVRGCRQEGQLTCSDPPVVDKSLLERLKKNPLKFKVGEKAKIEIPFTGMPPMSTSWTNGRVTLSEKGRFHMDTVKNVAKLEVDKCKVTDSGMYELTISNENGEAKIEIPIKVVDKPHAPSGEIAFSDVEADSVSMSWNPPIDDTIEVDSYVIEEKDPSGRWKKVGEVPVGTTEFKATGLKEGKPTQFRVKAKNEEGESEPLVSNEMTPTAKDVAPYIDPKIIEQLERNPIIVKAGETAKITVPCSGNPPPSASWMHDGEEILPVKHHRAIKNSTANNVTLEIRKCQTSDSGEYEARIFNNIGGTVIKTKIIVKDVPDFGKTPINFDKIDAKEVSMSWKAPDEKDNGGSPITGYIIERSLAGKNKWEKVGEAKPATTKFKCPKCEPGEKYVFRVKAVNEQGESEPAVSGPVTCGSAVVAPSVNPELIKALSQNPTKVKAGQTCRLKFPITGGEPPPTITWEKDGKPVEMDGKRVVSNHADHANANLTMHKCKQSDSGKYICKIKNEAGEVQVPVEVQVLDVPPAPEGPVEFSDISSKGLTVSWAPPSGDGGSKITHYVIEKREENRKVWSSVGKTADGATTSFRANVPGGKTYRFRVRAVSEVGDGTPNESQPVIVKDPYDPPASVTGNVDMVTATNDSISIQWNKVTSDGGSPLLGYYVEKRKKGTSSWNRCNPNQPCTDSQYTANNLRQDIEYEFRVFAVNKAGESDPSRASRPISASEPVDPPGEPSDIKLTDSTNTSLSFAWKGTDVHGGGDLLGYDIELKEEGSDKWQKYNDSHISGTSFTARGLKQGCSYHVRIRSVNVGSYSKYYRYKGSFIAQEIHAAPAFKMTSELETAVRHGFQINAGGTIRIHVPYHGRPRPDIRWSVNGHELHETVMINDADGISQLMIRNCKGIHSGTYNISLKNASGEKTLAIKVDVSDVPSPPQGPLQVSEANDVGMTLKWRPPTHDGGNPITGYTIQKREARGRDWQTIAQNVKDNFFTITDLRKQRSYYLRVQAENNIGKSEPLQNKEMVYIKEHVAKVQIEDVQYDEKDLRKPPTVTVPLKPRNVPEGVKVTLSCSIAGKPYPSTRWFKDNRDVTDDSHYFKENVIGLCRLVLTSVKKSDAGVYKVVAENSVGTASSEANLLVMD